MCEKIKIRIPPIIAVYRSGQETIIKNTNASEYQCKFLRYDESDLNFPMTYAQSVKAVHPKISIDINRANEVWLNPRDPQNVVDIKQWLNEEGFIEVPLKSKPDNTPKSPPKAPVKEKTKEADANDMYAELEQKYKELLQCYDDLKNRIEIQASRYVQPEKMKDRK